jgi:serine/threonine-protein kinase RsbW
MVTSQLEASGQEAVAGIEMNVGSGEFSITRAEIPDTLECVASAMADHCYSTREIFGVRLALEEAVVNAFRHGHRGAPTKPVSVSFLVNPDLVLLEVKDQGPGFDPKKVPNPLAPGNLERCSGRGLLLMRSYMTWVRFNDRGNSVTMCRHRERSGAGTKRLR